MATDSSELTFVRCPSCRSLVPAVSTRCRMCGATLDSGAVAKSEDDKGPRTSRVRQRTTSTQSGDVGSALTRVREEMSGTDAREQGPVESMRGQQKSKHTMVTDAVPVMDEQQAESASVMEAPDTNNDPLGAYIEDFSSEQPESIPVMDLTQNTEESEPMLGGTNGVGRSDSVIEIPPVDAQQLRARPTLDNVTPVTPAALEAALEQQARQIAATATPESIEVAESKEAPRVIIESGNRRGRAGLSFGKRREQGAVEQNVATEKPNEPRQGVPMQSAPQSPSMPQPTGAPILGVRRPATMPSAQNAPAANGGVSRASVVPVHSDAVTGRLAGWLISYDNPDGSAIELREGRFFVSGRSLKGGDLVLEDPSVSTPHALIAVDGSGIVKIQDLMSEHGVWLRQRTQGASESGDYVAAEDHIEVAHGDWIRFGEVEFLVSLIPYVGVK